jgi:hypothetical protein
MLTINAHGSRCVREMQQQPLHDVPRVEEIRPAGIKHIVGNDLAAKSSERQKSLENASKLLDSKHYAICSALTVLTVHQSTGMAVGSSCWRPR